MLKYKCGAERKARANVCKCRGECIRAVIPVHFTKISVKQIPIVLLLPFICDYCLSLNHHQENDSQHFASLWGPDRGGPTFNTISLQKCFIKSDLGNVSEEGHR